MIPMDWDVEPLSAYSETSSGTTPARAAAERYFHGGTIPWVKTLDLNNSVLDETDECVTETALRETSLRLYPAGSVLVAMYGGFAQIGRTGLLPFPATINQALTAICPNRRKLDSKYLLYFLNYHVDYWKAVASSSRKDPNITGNDVRNFLIALPSTEEQRLIATALSDVDALLDGLTGLIAKKCDLKQATMQRLLTGQTRLPGFSEEWEVKRLGEMADIRSGGTPSTGDAAAWDGEIQWCTPTDITSLAGKKYLRETSRRITDHGLKSSSAELIPAQSVLMTSRATIGECAINAVPVTTNQGFKNFIPSNEVDVEFLYYLLQTQKQGFVSLCGGSTFLEIGKGQLREYEVLSPKSKAEQTAIATVLSDMDAELAALDTRLIKTRVLKQAMMQELLTGKTRLLSPEASHV
ncbi:Type I restriction-modification system, specificity subunit S [Burkholderia sp. AU4i]|nr:Type I restriction-modification system, specificity subunit S [Burkholderia sp. AU4i]